MKTLLYHILLLCCLSSLFTGRRWVLYALALFTPLVQTLQSPYSFLFSPPNALLLGLLGLMLRAGKEQKPSHPVHNLLVILLWTVVLAAGTLRTWLIPPQIPGFPIDIAAVFINSWYWTTPFLMYWLLYQLVDSRDVARRVIALCMLSAVGEAFLAVYERLQGIGRATAHLDEPNRAGAFFAGTAVFFFAFVLMEKGRQRWPFLIAWVLTMTALFATLSRGGMLAAGLGSMVIFAIFLLFSEQKGLATKFNYMVLGILVAGNIALILPERVMDRLLVTVQGDPRETDVKEGDIFDLPAGSIDPEKMDDSAADRLLLWTVGLRLYREQPSGYGSFTATPLQAKYRGSPKAMHNIYLQVLVEHGIQGLACLVLLILTVARNLWKSFRKATAIEESTVLLGLLGYWVALCVAHFFVNPFFMLHLTGQFWIMSACALRACSEKEPVPSRMNDVKFAARGVAGRLQRDTTAWR